MFLTLFLALLLGIWTVQTDVIRRTEQPEEYRLSKGVLPISYDIKLTLEKDFGETFDGEIQIDLKTADKINTITLHADKHIGNYLTNNENKGIRLKKENNDEIIITDVKYNERTEILQLIFSELGNDTNLLLTASYKGKFSYQDMYGFYLSKYTDRSGKDEYLATTQFQPTYARRVFPCFDEPEFKATFSIAITHHNSLSAISNQEELSSDPQPNDMKTTKFKKTAKMSTYLVAFVVSKFAKIDVAEHMAIYTPQGLEKSAEYAKSVSKKVLERLGEDLGIAYWNNGMKKLDQVAIPDFAAGAMENWGLVTYRQSALLWDDNNSALSDKQRVLSIIAHEFAHNWFGNLVTMHWWEDTWLNEAFARYFEYQISHEVDDKFELDKQFITNELHSILVTDGNSGALPLSSSVNTQSEIKAKFGTITYSKGGCIVRMMRDIVGHQKFYKNLGDYIKTNKHKTTEPSELFEKLEPIHTGGEPLKMNDIMENWIKQSGYPVLLVSMADEGNKIIIKQSEFKYSKGNNEDEQKWNIKINYINRNVPDYIWLLTSADSVEIEVTKDDQIFVNPGQYGYYRVNYDPMLWSRINDKLKQNHEDIDTMIRSQIIDDSMNLARAGYLKYIDVFETLSYLDKETDYFPWRSAFNTLSYLRRRLTEGNLRADLAQFMSYKMKSFVETHGHFEIAHESSPIKIYSQILALEWACELNNEEYYTKAEELFDTEFEKISADFRSIIYCAAIRHESGSERWNKLWKEYEISKSISEKLRIITALGCTKKEDNLNKLLDYSLDNSKIRSQDALSAYKAVLTGNPEGVPVAFNFLKQKYPQIHENYGSMNALSSIIISVADRITNDEQLKEFKEFIDEHRNNLEDGALVADNAIEAAAANIKWTKEKEDELREYFKSSSTRVLLNVHLSTLSIASVIIYYLFN